MERSQKFVLKNKKMMQKMIKNKYLNAFLILLLYSAIFHVFVLIYRSFAERTIYPLNFFSILNLDILFPNMFKNTISVNAASFLVVVIIYFLILKYQKISIDKKH